MILNRARRLLVVGPHGCPRVAVVAGVAVLALVAACSADDTGVNGTADGSDRPTIVVTTSVLGAVVSEVVDGLAEVAVVVPDGADPHAFRPSAKDLASIEDAAMLVTNGGGLEPGLDDAIEAAADAGTPVFVATDHVPLRTFGSGEVPEHVDEDADAHAGEAVGEAQEEHDDGGEDPHFWVDPISIKRVVGALASDLAAVDLDVGLQAAAIEQRLDDLDTEVRSRLATIPPERRVLVTGHESLGYFADRYDLTVVGAVIPSTTSQAASSAGELAELKEAIEEHRVPAIFTEIGTPPPVVQTIADETGARVVELTTHTLPEDGSYFTFVRELASGVYDGLGS
jgi:zinc/manganese transport system substrate-binding protein